MSDRTYLIVADGLVSQGAHIKEAYVVIMLRAARGRRALARHINHTGNSFARVAIQQHVLQCRMSNFEKRMVPGKARCPSSDLSRRLARELASVDQSSKYLPSGVALGTDQMLPKYDGFGKALAGRHAPAACVHVAGSRQHHLPQCEGPCGRI